MDAMELELVTACERRIVNAWPSPSTLVIGDWVVRFANGYSGRANAATPLVAGAELDEQMFSLIEELYRGAGLDPCIRLTPLVAETTREAALARGYVVRDASFGLIGDLAGHGFEPDPEIEFETQASADWIAGVAALQSGVKGNAAFLAAIVEGVRLPAAFATLRIAGEPVGFGMSVAERGMAEIGSIVVDPGHRGQGLGQRLVTGLMGWGVTQQARLSYLQVDQKNAVAIRLYERLGYRRLYAYETRILA